MVRIRSDVWKHFRKLSKTSAKCNVGACGKEVGTSGNTKNLWNHLLRYHNIKPTSTSTPDMDREADNDMEQDDPAPAPLQIVDIFVDFFQPSTSTAAPAAQASSSGAYALPKNRKRAGDAQPTIEDVLTVHKSYEEGGARDLALKDALIYFVCRDKMPLCICENEGFRYFVKTVAPRWKLPHRTTLTTWIEKKYEKLENVTKTLISNLESYSLCADIWTEEHTTTSYLGVVLQYFDDQAGKAMKAIQLSMTPLEKPHCAEYIAEVMENIMRDWEIRKEKVKICITDAAENMKKAVTEVFGKAKWQPCFAHQINLLCSDMMKTSEDKVTRLQVENVPGLEGIISKVKKIAAFCHRSVNAADKLRDYQTKNMGATEGTAKRMIQEVPTRWNSKYLMLERMLELSEAVGAVLLGFPDGPPMLTAVELQAARSICNVLNPLFQVTETVSAEKSPTACTVIPLLNMMKKSIQSAEINGNAVGIALQKFLLARIEYRFGNIEKVKDFAIATLVDPRYKKLHFSSLLDINPALRTIAEEMRREARTETTILLEGQSSPENRDCPSPSSEGGVSRSRPSIWEMHDTLVSRQVIYRDEDEAGGLPVELRQYLNRPTLDKDGDPFQQWEVLKSEYPNLYKIARRYLPLIATSVAAERLFSRAGLVATDLRSRLTKIHLAQLLFLSSVPFEMWQMVM